MASLYITAVTYGLLTSKLTIIKIISHYRDNAMHIFVVPGLMCERITAQLSQQEMCRMFVTTNQHFMCCTGLCQTYFPQ